MSSQTVYSALVAIAESSQDQGLFQSFTDDLHKVDKQELDSAFVGDEFIWVLKKCGTYMAMIGGSKFSRQSTTMGMQGNERAVYHIKITGPNGEGTVKPVNREKATSLLAKESQYVLLLTNNDRYIIADKLADNKLLADCNIVRDSRASSFDITILVAGSYNARLARDIEQAVSDGVVALTGSLFTRVNSLQLKFAVNPNREFTVAHAEANWGLL